MKKILTGICFLLLAKCGIAQQFLNDKEALLKAFNKPRKNIKIAVPWQQSPMELFNSPAMQADTARFVSANGFGDIYQLPNDNMPCLKTHDVEPNSTLFGAPLKFLPPKSLNTPLGRIPNAYQGRSLVFEAPIAQVAY